MKRQLGVVMDAMPSLHYEKDSTLAMLWEATRRGYELFYFEVHDLYLRDGEAYGHARLLQVFQDKTKWYAFQGEKDILLTDLAVIMMRKDPPFNMAYLYALQLLAHAERRGTRVINRTAALRDYNEKLFATYFPTCTPPTLVTDSIAKLQAFLHEHGDIVCKPLDSMGGASVFRVREADKNAQVIFEVLTQQQTIYIMAQYYIPEIVHGDKRILMINGEPYPHALARLPKADDWRGNLAAGAIGKAQPLTERDHFICATVGPMLKEQGIYFAGLDVIGDYLTEINITSPTCIRELDTALHTNISALLFDAIEK